MRTLQLSPRVQLLLQHPLPEALVRAAITFDEAEGEVTVTAPVPGVGVYFVIQAREIAVAGAGKHGHRTFDAAIYRDRPDVMVLSAGQAQREVSVADVVLGAEQVREELVALGEFAIPMPERRYTAKYKTSDMVSWRDKWPFRRHRRVVRFDFREDPIPMPGENWDIKLDTLTVEAEDHKLGARLAATQLIARRLEVWGVPGAVVEKARS